MVNSAAHDLPSAPAPGLLDRAVHATDVAFLVTDALAQGEPVVWVNDAFSRLTGYAADDVVGRDAAELPDLPAPAGQGSSSGAQAEGAGGAGTVRWARPDGATAWLRVSVRPLRDDAGRVTHHVRSYVDLAAVVGEQGPAAAREAVLDRRRGSGLDLIARVSDLLTDLDGPQTLRDIAELLAPDVVAWAGFFLDENGLRPVEGIDLTAVPATGGHRHGPPPQTTVHQQALGLAEAGAAVEARPDPVQQVLDGTIEGPVEVDLEVASRAGGQTAAGWLAGYLRSGPAGLPYAPRTVTVLPVHGRRRVLGVLAVVPTGEPAPPGAVPGRGLDEGARTVLALTARRVGMAVENVRLYAREHRLAEALQRAMLPQQAEVSGLDVWTYYAPSSAHAQVGGDWFDVVQVDPDVVGIVVGDVAGHDIEAAAAMGQLRSVVRAYAYDGAPPALVLERVDQLVAGMPIPRSASLVLAALRRAADDGWTMQYSRAGHVPPVLVRGGDARLLSDASGPLIGFAAPARATAEVDLVPGDVLVLYTGGLVERRDRPLRDGVALLTQVCREVTAVDAAGIGEALLIRLADAPEDDVALVVVRLPDAATDARPTGGGPRRRRWMLPSEPASIGRARHAVVRTCHAWGLGDGAAAELVVSELMANAVMHGWGPVQLRLFDTGAGLRIEVEDLNPAPPVATDGHPGRVGGFGMQIVERLADWGWRPSGEGKLVWARVRPTGGPGLIPG